MHSLFRVLTKVDSEDSVTQKKDKAITAAEDFMDCNVGDEFDGYLLAGYDDWEIEDCVIVNSPENIRKIIEDLECCIKAQESYLEYLLSEVEDEIKNLSCRDMEKYLWEHSDIGWRTKFGIRESVSIVCGKFTPEALFFDLYNYTGRINADTFKRIKEEPDNWAIVYMDIHT